MARDVTERNRIKAERQELVRRLHETERLDTLGQAGGPVSPMTSTTCWVPS